MLTGTSFGTAATMGVICMTIAVSMQINPVLAGGAILAGAYFGDRCSPVSTSALLVSDLTGTNIFKNIKLMLKTALVPFLVSCVIYTIIGMTFKTGAETANLRQLFAAEMSLHFSTLFPALVILFLSLLRVNVKIAMSISIITAVFVCILIQGNRIIEVLQFMVTGFSAKDAELAKLLNGGGILSMLRVMAIVCISSAYAGIFQVTGLLDPIKKIIIKINNKTSSYCGTLFSAIITSLVACSQTLTIMLTHQLNKDIEKNTQKLAIDLEDSAVVVAPLVPWSIAAAVPLASIGAPSSSILAAFFLFLLPVWRLISNTSGLPGSDFRQAQQNLYHSKNSAEKNTSCI